MFNKILLIVICTLGSFASQAQVLVASLHPDSIASIPKNRFFFYAPNGYQESEESQVCLKTNVDLEAYIQLISDFHRIEARDISDAENKHARIWDRVPFPMRFYMHHSIVMQAISQQDYQLLTFHNEPTEFLNKDKKQKRQQAEKRKLGITVQESHYLQTLLNHLLFGSSLHAPFDLGSNASRFYLSREERAHLGWEEMFEIKQYLDGETGGMSENWSVNRITFEGNKLANEWAPTYRDSNYVFDLAEITDQAHYLNGTYYELEDEQLTAYGGGGYGSFNWHTYYRFGDSVCVRMTQDRGHSNDMSVCIAVTHYIHYNLPDVQVNWGCYEEEDLLDFSSYENLMASIEANANPEFEKDTLYFYKMNQGQIYSIAPSNYQMRLQKQSTFPPISQIERQAQELEKEFSFYQLYLGDQKLEDYIEGYIGYFPQMLLVEIYERGTMIFKMDSISKKYHLEEDLVLD
jgi:hypothetical protein